MSINEFYKKGDVISGKYEVRGVLGKGGFGVVYLVYDRELEELVALKTFRDELLADPKARNAFKKESLLWVNLEGHPHILAARWVSETSGRLFVTMDYIAPDTQGRVSLHSHLATANGSLDMNQVLGWAIQFCLGMEHAHANGLKCHRDIKPGNILIAPDWILKIADFGLAAAAAMAWDKSGAHCDSLVTGTREVGFGFSMIRSEGGMRCGTPGYMAPEVYRCEPADMRSDIYSFGLVLWQMAAGSRVPPFMAPHQGNIEACLQNIYEQQMAGRLPLVPGPLEPTIGRCLHPKPSERYGSFQELRRALESVWKQRTRTIFPSPQAEEKTAGFWNNKGGALDALGQHQEAIECYDKALTADPQDASTWSNKGSTLDKLGRHEEAIICYDKALTINCQCAAAWSNKGNALDELGQHERAIKCYDVALAIDPRDASAWINKGNTLNALRRHEEATQCLDQALAIDPRQTYAWNNKSIALSALGRYKEAISCSDRALAIDPQYVAAWTGKGNGLLALGRNKEAIDCYDKALAINSQYAEAWKGKGDALDKLAQHEEAIRCYDKRLTIDRRYMAALIIKGAFFGKSGRHEEAVGCYDKALVINPREENAWYGKALSEDGLGRSLEAIRSYQKFIEFASAKDAKLIADVRQRIHDLELKGI